MKTIILIIGLLMLNFNLLFSENVKVSTESNLNNLTMKWCNEYQKSHSNVKINITDNSNINFISDKSDVIKHKYDFKIAIGRDIIVPIMNTKNPQINDIKEKGITLQKLNNITKNKTLLDVQKDSLSIAFCKLTDIYNIDNITLVPIDKNSNGKIDFMENIYDNFEDFLRGVWIGKYPKSLYTTIYMISSKKPNESENAFINWILTDGQNFLNSNGYSNLSYNEQQSELNKLNATFVIVERNQYATTNIIFYIVIAIIIVFLVFLITFNYKKSDKPIDIIAKEKFFNDESLIIPKGLYFDKTHTWAFMEKDGSVKIGMDDFMQHIIGPITKIEMKNEGDKIIKNDPLFSVIQNGKKLNIYSPINGTIIAQNKKLNTNSFLMNTDPYFNGWVYTIKPKNWTLELQFLSAAEKYKKWITNEFLRAKDFFSTIDKSSYVILQDGGELKDNLLSIFDPKVWEDFQTEFIDTAIYTADKI